MNKLSTNCGLEISKQPIIVSIFKLEWTNFCKTSEILTHGCQVKCNQKVESLRYGCNTNTGAPKVERSPKIVFYKKLTQRL